MLILRWKERKSSAHVACVCAYDFNAIRHFQQISFELFYYYYGGVLFSIIVSLNSHFSDGFKFNIQIEQIELFTRNSHICCHLFACALSVYKKMKSLGSTQEWATNFHHFLLCHERRNACNIQKQNKNRPKHKRASHTRQIVFNAPHSSDCSKQ